jgi:hypothetical protein
MTIRLFRLTFNALILLLIPSLLSFDVLSNDTYITGIRKKSEKILEKAHRAIADNQYKEAESLVKRAINIDSTNIKSFLLLSDIYDELKKTEQKKFALKKIISLDSGNYPMAYKLLASLFFNNGDYDDALKNFLHYKQFAITKDSLLVSERIKSCNFALTSLLQNRRVKITHLDSTINTPLQEYWPSISTDDSLLYFTRLIVNEFKYAYERIFISEKNDSTWSEALRMNLSDDESVNIGTMCLSTDGNLLFFTACGRNDGRGSCDIYYVRKINNIWLKPQNAGSAINSSYWEAQPSVSSDNRFLYFASNRPGGMGGMDIWCSVISETIDGNLVFKSPVNLGKEVNSRENDFSPFIHADCSSLFHRKEDMEWEGAVFSYQN